MDNSATIKNRFYEPSQAALIAEMIHYFINKIRPVSDALVQTITDTQVPVLKRASTLKLDEKKSLLSQLRNLLSKYNVILNDHSFVTGDKLTYVDITLFNEIDTVQKLFPHF